jgi:transcriptional regulator with XRE-family HTH domain
MMVGRNALLTAIPFSIEQSLHRLGASLKTARLRRNLSLESVAAKIGTNRRVIADAENGKPSTGIAVYAALLWAYGLLSQLDDVAAPERDHEGLTLSNLRERARARKGGGLDDDF